MVLYRRVNDVSIWETSGDGLYDAQDPDADGPDCRGRLYTREDGTFNFLAIKPVAYPIPNDGPVGALLRMLGRHWMRPAHMHFMITHPDFNKLTTALFTRDDTWVSTDAGHQSIALLIVVFGVKSSLMVDYKWTEDVKLGEQFKIPNPEKGFWLLEYDFKLMQKTPPRARKVKEDQAVV